jgi:hypothetical protein
VGPDDWYLYGRATETEKIGGDESASVMEGYDANCCDGYDPDENFERGIVSAHEFGHTYGQENHPASDCGSWGWSCSVMDDTGEIDQHAYWFTDSTNDEMWWRYHYGCEHPC